MALTSVDLPTFGRPASAMKPLRVVTSARISAWSASISPSSVSWSMPTRCSVAVDDRLAQVGGVLGADDDVAELAQPGGQPGVGAVDREREDVGRALLAAVLGVELRDPAGVDELDRDVPVLDPGGGERERDEALGLRRRAARRRRPRPR